MNYLDITLSIGASVNGKHAHSTEHILKTAYNVFNRDYSAWEMFGMFEGTPEKSVKFQMFGIKETELKEIRDKTRELAETLKQYSIYLTAEPSHSEEIKSRPEVITATA